MSMEAAVEAAVEASKEYELLMLSAICFGDRFMAPEFEKAAHNHFISEMGPDMVWYESIIYAHDNLHHKKRLILLLDTGLGVG